MNKDTLKALQESIAHWEENLKNCPDIRIGGNNCALCGKFVYQDYSSDKCTSGGEKCPVYEYTGQPNCLGTYYYRIDEIFWNRHKGNEERLKKLVKAEVDFLKSLLPEGANNEQRKS